MVSSTKEHILEWIRVSCLGIAFAEDFKSPTHTIIVKSIYSTYDEGFSAHGGGNQVQATSERTNPKLDLLQRTSLEFSVLVFFRGDHHVVHTP